MTIMTNHHSSLEKETTRNDSKKEEDGRRMSRSSNSSNNQKVKIHFIAVGSAPLLKRSKFQIGSDQPFSAVTMFLRKQLKLQESNDSLFLYINAAFCPSPEESINDLQQSFFSKPAGELKIHYSLQEAWG